MQKYTKINSKIFELREKVCVCAKCELDKYDKNFCTKSLDFYKEGTKEFIESSTICNIFSRKEKEITDKKEKLIASLEKMHKIKDAEIMNSKIITKSENFIITLLRQDQIGLKEINKQEYKKIEIKKIHIINKTSFKHKEIIYNCKESLIDFIKYYGAKNEY